MSIGIDSDKMTQIYVKLRELTVECSHEQHECDVCKSITSFVEVWVEIDEIIVTFWGRYNCEECSSDNVSLICELDESISVPDVAALIDFDELGMICGWEPKDRERNEDEKELWDKLNGILGEIINT